MTRENPSILTSLDHEIDRTSIEALGIIGIHICILHILWLFLIHLILQFLCIMIIMSILSIFFLTR